MSRWWIHCYSIMLLFILVCCLSSLSSRGTLANITEFSVIDTVLPSIANNYTRIHSTHSSSAHVVQRNSSKHSHTVHIIFAFGERMVPITLVAIESIIHHSSDPRSLFFHFVLIDMHLNETQLNDFKRFVGVDARFEMKLWSPIPPVILGMTIRGTHRQELAAPANYARFYISSIFPSLTRFIYIDNDIIAVGSINELWAVDLGKSNVVGLVHECGTRFYKHVVQHKHYNVLSPVFTEVFKHTNYNCYPNAGVMLVDQQRFNQLKLLERIEQLIKLNKVEFIYRLGSQPLVTLTTWGRYLPLDDKWNARSGINASDAVLLHYNGEQSKTFMCNVVSGIINGTVTAITLSDVTNSTREYAWGIAAMRVFAKVEHLPTLKQMFIDNAMRTYSELNKKRMEEEVAAMKAMEKKMRKSNNKIDGSTTTAADKDQQSSAGKQSSDKNSNSNQQNGSKLRNIRKSKSKNLPH